MYQIDYSFKDGASVEILGDYGDFDVIFRDSKSGEVLVTSNIKNNHWTKTPQKYYVGWDIEIWNRKKQSMVSSYRLDLKDKIVIVHISSSSMGDNLAWFPYVEEFRKKHDCQIFCVSSLAGIFSESYPYINFITPSEIPRILDHSFAYYSIGWYMEKSGKSNTSRLPSEAKLQNMQKVSSDILGLDFKEIKPNLGVSWKGSSGKKLVCIGTQSTAQSKYWNYKGGWEQVVDYLKSIGYEVCVIDRDEIFGTEGAFNQIPKNAKNETGNKPLEDRMKLLSESDFFIGLGSGLSWLSWSIGCPTVLISGFSKPFTEPSDVIRIHNNSVCNGCFNSTEVNLDASNWNWCPFKAGTEDQYICTSSITPEMVIDKIKLSGLLGS